MKEYIKKQEGTFQLVKVYEDNGATGTNFERRAWKQLMEDSKSGKINCILVKDFSRIGRNYIEVGNYLETIVCFLNVRVIAVNENFDSLKQLFQSNMLTNALIHITNEYYARDISKKVSQAKRVMQKKGECVSSVLPYGYQKSERDKKKLALDMESADIVKKIFEWRIQGKKYARIASILNELTVPSPGFYRYLKGNQSFRRSNQIPWTSKHVRYILTNPVYLGHMVQGKTRCSYFEQEGKSRVLPKKDWIIVKNTHPPIITQGQFDLVEAIARLGQERA